MSSRSPSPPYGGGRRCVDAADPPGMARLSRRRSRRRPRTRRMASTSVLPSSIQWVYRNPNLSCPCLVLVLSLITSPLNFAEFIAFTVCREIGIQCRLHFGVSTLGSLNIRKEDRKRDRIWTGNLNLHRIFLKFQRDPPSTVNWIFLFWLLISISPTPTSPPHIRFFIEEPCSPPDPPFPPSRVDAR